MPLMFICSIFRLLVLGCVGLEVFLCVAVVDCAVCVGVLVGKVEGVCMWFCCCWVGRGGGTVLWSVQVHVPFVLL